jgi:hypothetical protein
VEDAIAVTNLGEAPATYTVSVGTGVIGADGAFDIAESAGGAGEWVTVHGVDGSTLTVEPGRTEVLPVTVAVPADALPGDHPAGIAVGIVAGDDVTVHHRVGVRVHVRVSGEVNANLAVRTLRATFTPSLIPFWPGTLRLDYQVENTGNVRLGATGTARAHGPFGWGAASQPIDEVRELLPGEAAPLSLTMSASPILSLIGDVDIAPRAVGEDEIDPPAAVTATFTSTAISWSGLAIVGAFALTAWWAVRRRVRGRRGHGVRPSPSMRRECAAESSA